MQLQKGGRQLRARRSRRTRWATSASSGPCPAATASGRTTRPACCSGRAARRSRSSDRPMRALRLVSGGGRVGPPPPRSGLGLEVDVVGVRGPHRARAGDPGQAPADARADRLHMGADTLRVEVKWNEVAPLPSAAHEACLRRVEPRGVPGLLPLRRPDRAGARARHAGDRHDHRRRAALGDRGRPRPQRRDRRTGRSAPASTAASRRGRKPLLRQVRRAARGALLHDLERAQPPQLPQAHVPGAARSTAGWSTRRCR